MKAYFLQLSSRLTRKLLDVGSQIMAESILLPALVGLLPVVVLIYSLSMILTRSKMRYRLLFWSLIMSGIPPVHVSVYNLAVRLL